MMLIITRNTGEAIAIGNDITVTILENESGRISIAVDAPEDMPILKNEIYQRIIETGRGELVDSCPNAFAVSCN